MNKYSGVAKVFSVVFVIVAAVYGCANRGSGPQGGPKDTTPPKILKYVPENNSTNVSPKKINLSFDEIVLVENSFEKVIISPPQTNMPIIKALGHKVNVELKDTLKPNTTYTINFTDAIVDNNEKNKLDGFTYSFSTGDIIDTLMISGIVIDTESLNPIPNVVVGIHSNMHDSAFTSIPFDRITKTNDKGEFTINNVKEGSYKIYALGDIGNNYFYDIPSERIAFSDTILTPVCTTDITYDTVFSYAVIDSVKQIVDSTKKNIDSVITKYNYDYQPKDIVLLSFEEKSNRQYLAQSKREKPYSFTLYFGNTCDSLPQIKPVNVPDSIFGYMLQTSPTIDTLTYWLTDSAMWKQDTLLLETIYKKVDVDSTYWSTDTLSLVYRSPKANVNKKGRGSKKQDVNKEKIKILSTNSSSKFEIYAPLRFSIAMPSNLNDTAKYLLQEKVDTLWKDINSTIVKTDSFGMEYTITHEWKPSTTYRIKIDSALFVTFNNLANDKDSIQFTTKSLEEYSTLIFNIKNYKGTEVIQLLDNKDKVVKQIKTKEAKTKIEYLAPGIYYAKLFFDENNNNKWDTGSYKDKRQAEPVYYFPYDMELRAFWDVEEDWDINEFPLLEQKPEELVSKQTKK